MDKVIAVFKSVAYTNKLIADITKEIIQQASRHSHLIFYNLKAEYEVNSLDTAKKMLLYNNLGI